MCTKANLKVSIIDLALPVFVYVSAFNSTVLLSTFYKHVK